MSEIILGEHIRNIRKEKGLSIRELARRSGVSNAYLSQLENGKTQNPSYEIIGKIAKGLKTNVAEILNEPDTSFFRLIDGNDLSYTDIMEMNEEQRNDFGRMFYENREDENLSYEEISFKTGIPEKDIELLEKGLLNRNLTEMESINLLQSFRGFEFYVVPRNDEVEKREFEIGNLILFNRKVNYKGNVLTSDQRREIFEAITKVMNHQEE